MIDSRYAQLQIVERWDWNRFARLCQFLRMTPFEVASLVMMSHGTIETYRRRGRLSGNSHRPVAMLLTLLEAHVLAKWTNDIIANPFPDLGTALAAEPEPFDAETERLRERCRLMGRARGAGRTSRA